MLALAWKGIIIGILVSAPMGPIGMLCIQRTLIKGRWHGFVTGLGAALSDIMYATIACLGMGIVVNFVETNQTLLQTTGSIVLGIFGYYTYQINPMKRIQKRKEKKISYTHDFISAFFLTFSNVLIILLFIGLFARFSFVLPEHSVWMIAGGVGCIAVGAIFWWFGITYIVTKLKRWFNIRGIWILNKVVGSAIMTLAVLGIVSVLLSPYLHIPLLFI